MTTIAGGRIKSARGFTLVEVVAGVAVLALMSLLLAANYPARMGIKQAGSETAASNMAFAVLEAIRAKAPDLDLDGTLTLEILSLSNPNCLKVTVHARQDSLLPDLYVTSVRVEDQNGQGVPVTMYTLIRKCSR